ncbi:hypothetical protein PV327_002219 [Microctonus hyperodae]|uniref:Mitochondrial inner membrane protease subunit n=1 Tax=Microctonus hyperodae TaxID=165561 RepID=A0AA39KP36_MICHY|nr:hypothetical protein PV327_002219 [Microctonus hyperodae]
MGLSPIIRSILIGIPIGITFVDTVGYVARVEGLSMQPALNPDSTKTDYVFLNRWTIRDYNLNHGDIISFVSPKHPNQTLIKRVIALEGDELYTIGYRSPVIKVPDGHCWVEGDHTGHSVDSNTFGPVSLGLITARATCIIWPPSRWQYLEPALPNHRVPLRISKQTHV